MAAAESDAVAEVVGADAELAGVVVGQIGCGDVAVEEFDELLVDANVGWCGGGRVMRAETVGLYDQQVQERAQGGEAVAAAVLVFAGDLLEELRDRWVLIDGDDRAGGGLVKQRRANESFVGMVAVGDKGFVEGEHLPTECVAVGPTVNLARGDENETVAF